MQSMPPINKAFLLLLTAVSIGFAAILWPFMGAVFWAVVLAILFYPLKRRLQQRMPQHHNLATFITLLLCLLGVILPLILIGFSVANETILIYNRIAEGQINFGAY
ncbi:MAG: AI-2E family transporter, partial [Comamonadaceae bacterium]|nr:AI-2E family transporter [Comamonadaceae bacterium]